MSGCHSGHTGNYNTLEIVRLASRKRSSHCCQHEFKMKVLKDLKGKSYDILILAMPLPGSRLGPIKRQQDPAQ